MSDAKRSFSFTPYTFQGRMLTVLLFSALVSCLLSAFGSFLTSTVAICRELEESQREVAVYLLELEQKTTLDGEEILSMASSRNVSISMVAPNQLKLTRQQATDLRQSGLLTVSSGFVSLPYTFVELESGVALISPSHDFNMFLKAFPRINMALALSLLLFGLLSILASIRISRPIHELTMATRQIREGDFSVRVDENARGEVGELMQSFNSMTQALDNTAYLQKDFIGSISHEFRTPIASIRGFARLLQMPGLDEASRQEYIGMIAQESDRLSRLSETLLRLSALEQQAAPASLTSFRLDEQLRQVILRLEPTWSAKNLDWQLELDAVTVESDEDLLTQVWINLLQNAVKFSPDGETIAVHCRQDDGVVVDVTDNGPGMDEETASRIFDRFYQADRSRSKDGVGLGLSLVKRIMDILGAKITVRTAPGEGSTFSVRLPATRSSQKGASL